MTDCMPLRVTATKTYARRLDFRMDVAHGLASRFYSDNIYVELSSESGHTGYGECVPRLYVTGETVESVPAALGQLLPLLTGTEASSPAVLISRLASAANSPAGRENPAAFCAAELALLDMAGRHWNLSVTEMLGLEQRRSMLAYSLVVPLFPPAAMENFLEFTAPFGFRQVKIKVNAEDPVGHVRRVKALLPPNAEVRVDANCTWNRGDALHIIPALADEGVVSVEQPLAADDLEGMSRLRGKGALITLDESVSGPDDVNRAAGCGACDLVNVRISKCGGILGAMRVIAAARRHSLDIQLGAQVGESCILSAAGALLAAGTPEFRWLEGGFGTHLLREDLCTEDYRFGPGGRLRPPTGSGLGIIPDRLRAAG